MPALIKLFLDEECTKELYRNDEGAFFFRYRKLNKDGSYTPYIDGTTGEGGSLDLYLKNVGTRAALQPTLVASRKSGSNIIINSVVKLKDIAVGKTAKATFRFTVSPYTESQLNESNITLDYYSLPDVTPEYIPYNKYSIHQPETYITPKIDTIQQHLPEPQVLLSMAPPEEESGGEEE